MCYAVVPERCTKRGWRDPSPRTPPEHSRTRSSVPGTAGTWILDPGSRFQDPVERSRWHFLWHLARGFIAKGIASTADDATRPVSAALGASDQSSRLAQRRTHKARSVIQRL